MLAYITPTFSGLTGAIATSFLREQGQTNATGKPSAWTGMVNYANGPLYLGAGYEKASHIVNGGPIFGSLRDIDVRSWKLGAGYTFGNATVNAIYDNIKLDFKHESSSIKQSAPPLV